MGDLTPQPPLRERTAGARNAPSPPSERGLGGEVHAGLLLRPREFGEVLDHSLELYRRNFVTLFGIYAVTAVPYVAISTPLTLRSLTAGPSADLAGSLTAIGLGLLVPLLYTTIVAPITCGAMTIAVSERFLGRPAALLAAYRRVLGRAPALIGSLLVVTLPFLVLLAVAMVAVVVAAVALVGALRLGGEMRQVVGLATVLWLPTMTLLLLLFMSLCGFIPAAVVLEGRGLDSIARSLQLAWPQRWRVSGLFAMLLLMVVLASAYLRLPSQLLAGTAGLEGSASSALLGALAMQVGIMLADPIRMVGVTLTYYDLRIRSEGFDLDWLARELGSARKGEPA